MKEASTWQVTTDKYSVTAKQDYTQQKNFNLPVWKLRCEAM